MGKHKKNIPSEETVIEHLKRLIMINTHRIDHNTQKIEELSYSTQCWNIDESKKLLTELSIEIQQLEESNATLKFELQQLETQGTSASEHRFNLELNENLNDKFSATA